MPLGRLRGESFATRHPRSSDGSEGCKEEYKAYQSHGCVTARAAPIGKTQGSSELKQSSCAWHKVPRAWRFCQLQTTIQCSPPGPLSQKVEQALLRDLRVGLLRRLTGQHRLLQPRQRIREIKILESRHGLLHRQHTVVDHLRLPLRIGRQSA